MTRHFLIAGAQRCGTTYLRTLLAEHPDIAMAEPIRPEPKVFLEPSPGDAAWYRRAFFAHARPGQLLGEKSTSYLDHPAAALEARRVLGDPQVLVQLRDPIERAVSHWSFSTDQGLEDRSLTDVLEANLTGPLPWDGAGVSVSPYAYLERGRYADALRPWLDAYGDRVRVLFLEDLVAGPDTLEDTLDWLGVDPTFRPPSAGVRVNPSTWTAPASSSLGSDLCRRLRRYFAEPDGRLADLLGRRLPWGEPAGSHT